MNTNRNRARFAETRALCREAVTALHDAVHEIMGNCKLDAADTRKRVDKDIHLMSKG